MALDQRQAGGGIGFDRRAVLALCMGWFMVTIDATIVNVALPSIGRDLAAPVTGLQWVVDAYIVTFAALLLPAGWLADRVGARRIFLAGLVLFGLASVGCALAPGLAVLVASRVLQGIGAAMLVPASLSLIQASYPDRDTRAQAIAVWAAVGGFAGAAGPVLGGVFAAAFGWRAIFWVNLPVAALGVGLVLRLVPIQARHGTARPPFDVAGQVIATVALLGLVGGVVEAGRAGWGAAPVRALLTVGVLAAIAAVLVERHIRQPLLSPVLFADRGLVAALGVGFLINFAFYGALFILALHWSRPTGTGCC